MNITSYVYILYSKEIDKYHVGVQTSLQSRITKARLHDSSFMKRAEDWEIVYIEVFKSKLDALKRKDKITSMKSREYIERIIDEQLELS